MVKQDKTKDIKQDKANDDESETIKMVVSGDIKAGDRLELVPDVDGISKLQKVKTKVRIIGGDHIVGGKTYRDGDVVELSDSELELLKNKWR